MSRGRGRERPSPETKGWGTPPGGGGRKREEHTQPNTHSHTKAKGAAGGSGVLGLPLGPTCRKMGVRRSRASPFSGRKCIPYCHTVSLRPGGERVGHGTRQHTNNSRKERKGKKVVEDGEGKNGDN